MTEAHKRRVAGVFGRAAADYDRVGPPVFGPIAERLVDLAGVGEGMAVLDVACGAGAVLETALRRTGPEGRVVGIDLSPEMVAEAGRRVPAAEVREMDAERLDFAGERFDRVLCASALFLLPDPEAALVGFRRMLRSGGVVGISSWSPDDSRWLSWSGLLTDLGIAFEPLMTRSASDSAAVESLVSRAGFEDASVAIERDALEFDDERDWWTWLWTQGQRATLERLDPRTLSSLEAEATARVAALRGDDGRLSMPIDVTYATARR